MDGYNPLLKEPGISIHLTHFAGNIYTNQTVTFLALLWSVNYLNVEWSIFPNSYKLLETSRNRIKLFFYESGFYTVTAFSKVDNVSNIKVVSVLLCGPPTINLIGPSDIKIARSVALHLEVAVDSCPLHPVNHKWEIIEARWPFLLKYHNVSDVLVTNTSTLYLYPKALSLGKYVVKFTSIYNDTGEYSEVYTNLTIVSSLIKAIILGGDERIISVVDEIYLNGSHSFDPDKYYFESQELAYYWSYIYNSISCNEIISESPILCLPPNYLKPDQQYMFLLRVKSKNSSSMSLPAKQIIHTRKLAVPQAAITCLSCMDSGLYYTSHFHVLKLSGSCYGHLCDGNISYNWTVIRNDSQELQLNGITTTGRHFSNLVVIKFTFDHAFSYSFKLQISRHDNLVGYASMALNPLELPPKKSCSSNSMLIIIALVDFVQLLCSGHIGPDNNFEAYRVIIVQNNHPHSSYVAYEGPNGNLSFFVSPFNGRKDFFTLKVFVVSKYGSYRLILERRMIVITPILQAEDYFLGFLNEHLALARITNNFKETLPNIISFLFLLNAYCKTLTETGINDSSVQFQKDSRQNIFDFLNDYMVIGILADIQQVAHLVKLISQCYIHFPNDTKSMDGVINILSNVVEKSKAFLFLTSDGSEIVPDILFSSCENIWNNILHKAFDQNSPLEYLLEQKHLMKEIEIISENIITIILQTKILGEEEYFQYFGEVIAFGNRSMNGLFNAELSFTDFVVNFEDRNYMNHSSPLESINGFVVFKWNKINKNNENTQSLLFDPFVKYLNGVDILPELSFNMMVPIKHSLEVATLCKNETEMKNSKFHDVSAITYHLKAGDEIQVDIVLPVNTSHSMSSCLNVFVINYNSSFSLHIDVMMISNQDEIKANYFKELRLQKEYALFNSITSRELIHLDIKAMRMIIKNYDNSTEVNLNVTMQSFDCISSTDSCQVTDANETHVTCSCNKSQSVLVAAAPFQTSFVVTILKPSSQKVNVVVILLTSGLGLLFIIGMITTHFWDESYQIQDLLLFGGYEEISYLIMILMKSGTTANIGFQICGNEESTEKIHLDIPQTHMNNSQVSFFVATKRCLGEIKSVEIWHDNSGIDPTWNLFWIFVKDLTTKEIYNFDCRCILNVKHTIHRSFIPSVKPSYLSKVALQLFQRIKNQHILFSIFKCLPFDLCGHLIRFVFACLFLSLLFCFSAFYFQYFARTSDTKDFKEVMLEDFLICLFLFLTAWSITIICYKIFRKSIMNFFKKSKSYLKTKKLALENEKPDFPERFLDFHEHHLPSENSENDVLGYYGGEVSFLAETTALEIKNLRPKPTKTFRHSILAVVVSIFLCLILTAIFGRNFPPDVFMRWIYMATGGAALILIFCETIRVSVLALLNAAFRSLPEDYFESLNCHCFLIKLIRQISKIEPLGGFSLSEAKHRYENRKHFRHIFKLSILHFLLMFATGLMIISTTENKKCIELRRTMEKHFDEITSENIKTFDRTKDIWRWIETTTAKASSLKEVGVGNHIFLQPIKLRQIRITPLNCITDEDPDMKKCSCNPHWLRDEGNYETGWKPPDNDDNQTGPWVFKNANLPITFSMKGRFGRYGDEGYSIFLRSENQSEGELKDLKRNAWIDDRTKVVSLEFVAYSPSFNMFSTFSLSQEVACTGSVHHLHLLLFLSLFEIQSTMTVMALLPCASLVPSSILLILLFLSKQSSRNTRLKLAMKIALCWMLIASFTLVVIKDNRARRDYFDDDEPLTNLRESHGYQQLMKNVNVIFFWILFIEVIQNLEHLSLFKNLSRISKAAILKFSRIFVIYMFVIMTITVIRHSLMPWPGSGDQTQHDLLNSFIGSFHNTFVLTTIINKLFLGFAISAIMFTSKFIKRENSSEIFEKQSFTDVFVCEIKQIFGGRAPKRPTFQRVQFQESLSPPSSSSSPPSSRKYDFDSVDSRENSLCESLSIISSDLAENISDPFFAISVSLDVTQYRLDFLTRHDDDD